MLSATISIQSQRIEDLEFDRIGDGCSIHILQFTLILTMFLHFLLIIQPLIGKDISAVHTTNGNNHEGVYLNQGKGVHSIFIGAFIRIYKCSTNDQK